MQVVAVLKKELMRTQGGELERSGEYRQVLVQCVHKCAVKYPDVASAVVHILMEFLGDNSTVGALPCVSIFVSSFFLRFSAPFGPSCAQRRARCATAVAKV